MLQSPWRWCKLISFQISSLEYLKNNQICQSSQNMSLKLFGYFFAAGSGVIVQYLVGTIICIRFLGFPFEKGILWGFIISFPVGFILAKIFAFKAKGSGNTRREIIKFLMVVIISGLITVKGSYYSLIIFSLSIFIYSVIFKSFISFYKTLFCFLRSKLSFDSSFIVS